MHFDAACHTLRMLNVSNALTRTEAFFIRNESQNFVFISDGRFCQKASIKVITCYNAT